MPRTRRSSAVTPAAARQQVPLAGHADLPADPLPPSQPTRRRTVASNAQAIDSMGLQLFNMSQMLERISGKMGVGSEDTAINDSLQAPARADVPAPGVAAPAYPPPAPAAQPPPHIAPTHFPTSFPQNNSFIQPRHGVPNAGHVPHMPHVDITVPPPHTQGSFFPFVPTQAPPPHAPRVGFHPLGTASAQTPFRDLPTSLQDLEDIPGLQDGVAHLLSTTLAPLSNITGKKLYAHSFIKRGNKRARTTLGDLSLAEYNTGFIKLMNSNNVSQSDRPHMFTHLAHINEDAAAYEWQDVRYWSEEVCALVAEGTISWDDRYTVDSMRLKFSQKNRKVGGTADQATRDGDRLDHFHVDMTSEVRAAKPAPPCRSFNNGTCTSKTHHVSNGFRHLHVCAFCIYHKCSPLPHPEKECCSKLFKKTKPRDSESGFGK